MKVLLDECVPERFRTCLTGHEVNSARFAGFRGWKNGVLLQAPEEAGYDVLVTVDRGIPYQQRMSGRRIALLILRVPANDIDTLTQMAGAVVAALATIPAGQVVELDYPAR